MASEEAIVVIVLHPLYNVITSATTLNEYLTVLDGYAARGLALPPASDLAKFYTYNDYLSNFNNTASDLGIETR